MSTPSMIWVLIRATEARNVFLNHVDSGNFKQAIDMKSQLEGMVNQLKSFVQQHGAGCQIACEDVVSMKIPVTLARNLESIMELYMKGVPGIAVGVGFNYFEAAAACKRSKKTRQIELYKQQNGETLNRSEDPQIHKLIDESVVLPTNLYDPLTPTDDQYLHQLKEPEVIDMPGFEKEIQAETAYVKILATQMGSPSDAQIQQAQQQQAAQQQAAQQQVAQGQVDQSQNPNAKSMLGALGKNPPKPNDKDENGEDKEDSGKSLKDAKKDKPKEDKPEEDDSADDKDPSDMSKTKLEAEIKQAESEAKADHNQKLFDQLDRIKSDLPQIMGLAQKDPKAFKSSMQMIGKLLDVAKKIQKGEIDLTDAEVLEKTRVQLNLPVGTRKGVKKKVAVAGKPDAWRSMRTGQLKDEDDGSPISVREHNVKMKQKTNDGI